jgi:hypothetical protein
MDVPVSAFEEEAVINNPPPPLVGGEANDDGEMAQSFAFSGDTKAAVLEWPGFKFSYSSHARSSSLPKCFLKSSNWNAAAFELNWIFRPGDIQVLQ